MYTFLSAFLEELDLSGISFNFGTGSLGLIAYVFQALALYIIAKRRGIKNPWMVWVPVVNAWTLGAISDHYQQTVHNSKKKKRKILLGLSIAVFALAMILVVALFGFIIDIVVNYDADLEWFLSNWEESIAVIEILLIALLVVLPLCVLAIVYEVIRWIAVYDVFRSCDPKNTTLYFLIGLLVGIFAVSGLESVFMLLCMNKDDGMAVAKPEEQMLEQPAAEEDQSPQEETEE